MPREAPREDDRPRKNENLPPFRKLRAVVDPKTGRPRMGPDGRPVAWYYDEPPREPRGRARD